MRFRLYEGIKYFENIKRKKITLDRNELYSTSLKQLYAFKAHLYHRLSREIV